MAVGFGGSSSISPRHGCPAQQWRPTCSASPVVFPSSLHRPLARRLCAFKHSFFSSPALNLLSLQGCGVFGTSVFHVMSHVSCLPFVFPRAPQTHAIFSKQCLLVWHSQHVLGAQDLRIFTPMPRFYDVIIRHIEDRLYQN
eukprot:Gb_29157 [translate_table: standard]